MLHYFNIFLVATILTSVDKIFLIITSPILIGAFTLTLLISFIASNINFFEIEQSKNRVHQRQHLAVQ